MLHVYHQGKHECYVKPNVYENDAYINQALEESGGAVGPKQLAYAQMTKEMTRQQTTGVIDMKANHVRLTPWGKYKLNARLTV